MIRRAAPSNRWATARVDWRHAFVGAASLALWALAGVSWAGPEATLAPSTAAACMTPALADRGRPEYPEEPLRLKERSTVEIELVFEAPGEAPEVKFLNRNHRDVFERPIKDYARTLRVPCMAAGAPPVRLRQEFVFEPNDGRKVVYTAISDAEEGQRRKLLECAVWPKGEAAAVEYPPGDLRALRQGIVVVRARFVDPGRAPELEVLDNGGSRYFVEAVRPYLAQMRMPCLEGDPLDLHMFFRFMIDGASGTRQVLKDLSLREYLGMGEVTRGVYFDTTMMACPFDVRLKFRQPFEPNGISELEAAVPARHAFLDWLASVKLKIDPKLAKELFSQESTVHVPCTRIDL